MTFSPDVEHEGVALTRGARRVVAVFTDECSKKAAPERDAAREAQRLAALQVFGRLKPPSRTTPCSRRQATQIRRRLVPRARRVALEPRRSNLYEPGLPRILPPRSRGPCAHILGTFLTAS